MPTKVKNYFRNSYEYFKNNKPKTMPELIAFIICAREFKWILGAIVIVLIYNPDWIVKFKLALMNGILQLMK